MRMFFAVFCLFVLILLGCNNKKIKPMNDDQGNGSLTIVLLPTGSALNLADPTFVWYGTLLSDMAGHNAPVEALKDLVNEGEAFHTINILIHDKHDVHELGRLVDKLMSWSNHKRKVVVKIVIETVDVRVIEGMRDGGPE